MKSYIALIVFFAWFALLATGAQAADSNLHVVEGKMTDCGCEYFPEAPSPQWVCFASIETAAPAPHFGVGNPAFVSVELEGQAIGQCSQIEASLPRRVRVNFWLQAAGPDFIRGIYRTGRQAYYLIDLGNP